MNLSLRWMLPLSLALAACSRESSSTSTGAAASTAAPAMASGAMASGAMASASARPGNMTAVALPVKQGKASFLIDAPLEKIKGEVPEVKGEVRLDPVDLGRTRGEVSFRVTTLRTATFDDAKNDAAQTEHARNWLQVGPKSEASDRGRFEWATFRLTAVETTPVKLADAPVDADGSRTVTGKATGDLNLHGITRSHTVMFKAKVRGPVEAPTEVTLTSDSPVEVSLKDHDVRPRDEVGSLLAGALEKIGKKISDKVQVSLELKAGS